MNQNTPTQRPHFRRAGGRAARGFTMLEMLITVAVTAMGFAAIFAMQLGALQGNISSREMTAAVNLAERYVEVLRRDSYEWDAEALPAADNRLSLAPQIWHTFTPNPYDQHGLESVDVAGAANGSQLPRQRFCAHYWFQQMAAPYDGVLNVRVRVIWPRDIFGAVDFDAICPEADADGFVLDATNWFIVTVPVTLRRHPES